LAGRPSAPNPEITPIMLLLITVLPVNGPLRTPSSLGERFDHRIAKAMAFMPANIPNTSIHPKFPSINNLSAQKPRRQRLHAHQSKTTF
jgi:hypothetical protein